MVKLKRAAEYVATLIYMDEPQVVHLMSKTVPIVAVAVPSDDPAQAQFLAATCSQKDWEGYLEGASDLRYLFVYPRTRMLYTFDLNKIKKKSLILHPYDAVPPEEWLPPPRLFATDHTEEFDLIAAPAQTEQLIVDGEWQLQEFGRFYQRYSDIYVFSVAQMNWASAHVSAAIKARIKVAFGTRPFKGGSSYLHLFNDLFDSLQRDERIGLDKVKYASPGYVDVNGRADAFAEISVAVRSFLSAHNELKEKYSELHTYLSERGYLKMPGDQYDATDGSGAFVKTKGKGLADAMPPLDYATILELSRDNVLVAAKVVLSYYRRLDEASEYFAQGRVHFEN